MAGRSFLGDAFQSRTKNAYWAVPLQCSRCCARLELNRAERTWRVGYLLPARRARVK